MANPPITKIDFSTGQAVVYADTAKYTFPIKGLPAGTVLPPIVLDPSAAIDKLRADMGAKLDAILAVLAAPPQAAATPPAPSTDTSGWLISKIAALTAPNGTITTGATLLLAAGTEKASTHIDVTLAPITVQGAGMRATILDGQGGVGNTAVGAAARLAWGKGVIHTTGSVTVEDVGFINGGGADGKSDGEAGFYADATTAAYTAHLVRCAFDGGENGIFVPQGSLATLIVEQCVFGAVKGNGLADGSSHDMYTSGASVLVKDSVFAGTSAANTIKCRGPALTVVNNWIGRTNGRWLDVPGEAVVVSSGNTYVTLPACTSQNALGFDDEGDTKANPGKTGSFTSDGDTYVFSRFNEVLWDNDPNFKVTITNAKVFWIGTAGSTPPTVTIQGPGALTGPNPFVFTEANRLDAAPAATLLPGMLLAA